MSDDNVAIKLHSTMDAQVWAKEFMQLFGHKLNKVDEGLMISWFANSMMVGHDFASRKDQEIISRLADALRFYANERHYTKDGIIFDAYNVGDNYNPVPEAIQDFGDKARSILKELGLEKVE